jgi:2-polyprenyl-3-methyl-5-hydroxy-6-metoxy-1,4-benzoquinol methylase
MMGFARRATTLEKMDEGPVGPTVLRDLARVNRVTFAFAPIFRFVRRAGAEGALLDVACGYGDLLRRLARRFPQLRLTGIDLHVGDARSATVPGIELLEGDVFALDRDFDLIVSSQFAHHLDDEAIVRFIRWLEAHARRGWFICDLHRHWLPYRLIGIIAAALRLDPLIAHDGAISVTRSFVRRDWERFLAVAGVEGAEVRWSLFRWGVGRLK